MSNTAWLHFECQWCCVGIIIKYQRIPQRLLCDILSGWFIMEPQTVTERSLYLGQQQADLALASPRCVVIP